MRAWKSSCRQACDLRWSTVRGAYPKRIPLQSRYNKLKALHHVGLNQPRKDKSMTQLFDRCVELLRWTAEKCGITYEAINVWIFCIIWPLLTVALIVALALK